MIYSNLAGTTSNTFQINDGAKFYKNLLPYNLNWQTNSFPDANIHEITTMGLDLNTIKTPGQYYCIIRNVINSLVNCPVKDEGFLLTVEPSTGNLSTSLNHVHQCLISYKGGIWHRWFGSQGEIFIGWVSLAYNETLSLPMTTGMWSPSLSGSGYTITQSSLCYWAKYGNVIIVTGYIRIKKTASSGSFVIAGLPYPMGSYVTGNATIACDVDIVDVSGPSYIMIHKGDSGSLEPILQMWVGGNKPQNKPLSMVLPQNSTTSITINCVYLCKTI